VLPPKPTKAVLPPTLAGDSRSRRRGWKEAPVVKSMIVSESVVPLYERLAL